MAHIDKVVKYTLDKFSQKYNITDTELNIIQRDYKNNISKIYYNFSPIINKNKYVLENEKVKCECGAIIKSCSYKQHLKTDKHINFIFGIVSKYDM